MRADGGAPRARVAKPAAKKPAAKPASGFLSGIVNTVKQANETVQAKPKAGTAPQRKAIRKSYDNLPAHEKKRILSTVQAGTVVGDTILSTHARRVHKSEEAKQAKDTIGSAAKAVGKLPTMKVAKSKREGGFGPALVSAVKVATLAPVAEATLGAIPGVGGTLKDMAHRAAQEAVDIPLNTPASLYHLGDTAIHDPVKAGKELAQPYIHAAEHPVHDLVHHPLSTLLLATGVKGGVGRAAGGVMRHSGVASLEDAASTAREPATVPNTSLVQNRTHSPDVLKKVVQVKREKRATVKAAKTEGARPPHVMSDTDIRRRVDEHVAASEDLRRHNRAVITHQAHDILHDAKPRKVGGSKGTVKPNAGTTLAVQGVARSVPDLKAYLASIEHHGEELKAAGKGVKVKANRTAQKDVQEAIDAGTTHEHIADRFVKEVIAPLQAKLHEHGLVHKDQTERTGLIPYARTHMGAKYEDGKIVAHDGSELSNDAIRADMRAHGFPEPGYVTNAPNQRGARNFHVAQSEAPRPPSGKRKGDAILQGTADLHPDVLIEGAARAQGLADAADRYGAFIREFGHRLAGKTKPHNYANRNAAQAAADALLTDVHGNPIPGAVKMRPVLAVPFRHKGEQLRATLEHDSSATPEGANHPVGDVVQNALGEHAEGKGPWVLVPDVAADQMIQHARVTGAGVPGKTAQVIGSRFRTTVLATNPKWLVGNDVEAGLRTGIAHAGPRSYMLGRRALARLDEIDPKAAAEARARMVGGGHMALGGKVQTYSSAEQYAGTKLAPAAQALGKFWRTPGPKQLAAAWHGYTDVVFNQINGPLEAHFQTAMLGKALKDSPLMSSHLNKLSKAAIDDAANGLRDTNNMVALGREVDRMYGRYSKFPPATRHLIAGYTPFIAWALNATDFLVRVLPQDHPVLTSMLAAASVATEDWRKQHGLKFGDKNAPWYLQGSIPTKHGYMRAAKFTPFGVMQSPSGVGGVLAGSLLPQFQSVLQNLQGRDWKGNQLKPGQSPALEAIKSLAEGSIPFVGQGTRIAANPGSTVDKFRKELDPTYAISSKKKGSKKVKAPAARSGDLPALPNLPPLPALPNLPPLPALPKLPSLP